MIMGELSEWGVCCGQTYVDWCSERPCANGAHCRQMGSTFQCSCLAGWRGQLCDVPTVSCSEVAKRKGTGSHKIMSLVDFSRIHSNMELVCYYAISDGVVMVFHTFCLLYFLYCKSVVSMLILSCDF